MTTPTPLSRACARVLALLLAVAAVLPASAAVTGWKEVRAKLVQKDYVFYYPVVEQGRPVVTNEGGHPAIRLYKKPVLSDAEKAKSHLFSRDGGKTFKLHLIAEEGPERDLAKSLPYTAVDSQAPAPAPAPTAPALPEGVDAAVWAEVQSKYAAGLSAEDQVLLAKTLTHVKKNNADKYAGVQAWLQKDPKANAAKVAQAAKARGVPAAAGELLAWASAAPSGAAPAPAPAPSAPQAGPGAPPVGPGVPVGGEGGPLTDLQRAVKPEAQWQDVAARLIAWTWAERAEGRSFITPDARKNPNSKTAFDAALKVVVQDKDYWPSALNVYYLIGPGESVPAWVTADPTLKKLLVDDQVRIKAAGLETVLGECLDRWQHNPTSKLPTKCGKDIDRTQVRMPFPGKDLAAWPRDFLKDAGLEAVTLLQAVKVGTGTITGAVGGSPNTVGQTPGGPGTRPINLPALPTGTFGVDQMFGKWGDANVFSLDGRILALVVRTNKSVAGDPPKTTLTHQLGLYDISNPGDVYGKRFDVAEGAQSISLIPGGKAYSIKVSPQGDDMAISIERPGGVKPQVSNGSDALPTLNQLYQNRARQALDSGNRVMIAGRPYRVTSEGTATGNLLFWDEGTLKAQADAITDGGKPGVSARYWIPDMMAEVAENRDNRPQNISDKVSLGQQINGKWQGIRWDGVAGQWVPAEGDEYKPKVPAPPAPAPGTPPAGGTPPGTGPGTPPGTAPPPASPRPGAAAALNAKLSAEVKPITGFLDVETPKKFGEHLIVTRLKSDGTPAEGRMTHPAYPGLLQDGSGAGDLREDIVAGRYLQMSSNKGHKFWDLKNFDLVNDGGLKVRGEAGEFTLAEGIKAVRDKTVLSAVLKLAGYTGDEAKIMANLDAALKGSANWSVAGFAKSSGNRLSVSVDNRNCSNIWPTLTLNDCAGASEQSPSTVPGAGNGLALDAAGNVQLDANMPFGDEYQAAEGRPARRVEPKPADAALYQGADGERKLWYLSFIAAGSDGKKVKRMPSLVFSDKKEGAGGMRYPKKPVTISGLTVKGDPDQTYTLRAVVEGNSLEDSGYIGAYTSSANDSCVGVVASWGLTHQAACGRCGAKWEGGRCVSTK